MTHVQNSLISMRVFLDVSSIDVDATSKPLHQANNFDKPMYKTILSLY